MIRDPFDVREGAIPYCSQRSSGMMKSLPIGADLLGAFEAYSPDDIRALLVAGVSPIEPTNGRRPIDSLRACN